MNLKLGVVTATCALAAFSLATEGSFDSKGVNIRYVSEGSGEAIVFIHGWMGDSSTWGKKDASGKTKLKAASGFRLIAIDCRGHGESGKPHDPSKYGAEMANDVVRLLDHLKIKKAHLIGYSMGSFIVGKVAATHPDRLLSAIYGGQAPIMTGGAKSTGDSETEIFAKAVESGKGLGSYFMAVAPAGQKPTLEQANAYAKFVFTGKDVKALAAAGRSFGKLAVSAKDLQKCKVPTLFVYGGEESAAVKNAVATAKKALPKAETVVIEGANHMTTLINPKFGEAMKNFLMAHRERK